MKFDVVLLPSFAQVENWRKARAEEGVRGVFAQVVTTFDGWIADLWELHGDGRAIVGGAQREVIVQTVLQESGGALALPGMVALASSCVRAAAGVREFEDAVRAVGAGEVPGAVSTPEADLLSALGRYSRAVRDAGLVEPGEAAALLAERAGLVFPREISVLMPNAAPLGWVQRQFFESCSQVRLVTEPAAGADGVGRAPEGVQVRFTFPSGRLAEPGLVADAVLSGPAEGGAVVACKDPVGLFGRIGARLAEAGFRVAVQGRVPFARTDFGRAFMAQHVARAGTPWNPAALSDALRTVFSGASAADAVAADCALRADRAVDRDDALFQADAVWERFSQLGEVALDPDGDILLGVFDQMAQEATGRSAAWRAEQLAAIRALRDVTSAARRWGAGARVCADVLDRATVPVSAQVAGKGPLVVLMTQGAAARLQPGSCSHLVIADLTAEDYPVAERDDAAATLFGKLGLHPADTALNRARRDFHALLGLPTQQVSLLRPLGDANADETYPSVVLEEFVDSYRDDPTRTDDIENAYRLPACLQGGLVERGEELLFANAVARAADAVQDPAASVPEPAIDDLGPDDARLVPVVRRNAAGEPLRKLCPSPSQIELYLECPFQWFAARRLRAEGVDECFGPLERGSFAHAALERFYRGFQERGQMKVSAGNLADARGLMRSVLRDLVAEQAHMQPGSGRLVAVDELEQREVAALCDQLVGYLDYEAKLLPTYRPAYLEFEIDADHAVDYAGFSLVGKVDRIDVDDAGHAVIIDYKGSVNAEHSIAGKGASHAGKVQTRIYAQAVKRALGLDVVAALYVSYGRRPTVSGAYDPRVVDAAHLPGANPDNCACGLLEQPPDSCPDDYAFGSLTFGRMLDETECLVGSAVAGMASGAIAPEPAHERACAYCPVLDCPKRGDR